MARKQPEGTSALHLVVKHAPDLAASSRDRYMRDLNAWIAFAGDSPANWTIPTAQRYYAHLLETMKPQSATRMYASLQYAAKWWANELHQPHLNFTLIRMAPSEGAEERHELSPADAIKLLSTCDGSVAGVRDFALMVVGFETGMRRMSLSDMAIERTEVYPGWASVKTKGSRSDRYRVVLSDTACAALAPWAVKLTAKRGPVFRPITIGVGPHGRGAYIQPREMSGSAIHQMVAKRGERVGVTMFPHLFRHSYASWRAAAGHAPHAIAAVTGHSLDVGALGGYLSKEALAETMRHTTPPWLAEAVARHVRDVIPT